MLLAIDIGNTNINCGLFKGKRLLKRFSLPTPGYSRSLLEKRIANAYLEAAVICSVVPEATKVLARDLRVLLAPPVYIIGKDFKVPIKNLYRKPRQVGQDRLVNAYAGLALYQSPLIIIDFGTAITFDVISKDGDYLGGMIIPGLELSLRTLAQNTALLPKVKLARPREFIGRDTRASILSGIIYGFAALSNDLVARIKSKIGQQARVIATGGNARLVADYCKEIERVIPELTLTGINLCGLAFLKKFIDRHT